MPIDIDPSGFSLYGVGDVAEGLAPSAYSLTTPLVTSMPSSLTFADALNVGGGGAPWWSPSSWLPSLADVTKGLQLGLGGLGIYSNIRGIQQLGEQTRLAKRAQGLQEEATRRTFEAAAPLREFGTRTLESASAGRLPPAMEDQVQNWIQGAKTKMHDYLARIGQGDSQTLAQIDAEIERQAQDMRATALAQQQAVGISALTSGAGATAQAGGVAGAGYEAAQGQQASLQQLIAQANEVLAQLVGGARA